MTKRIAIRRSLPPQQKPSMERVAIWRSLPPRQRPCLVHSASNEAGFTLIELLVSLVLVALLLAAVPPALNFAQRSVMAVAALDHRSETDAALTFVEQRLAETTAIYDRGDDGRLRIIFSGEANAIAFMAPFMLAEASGLSKLELKIEDASSANPDGLMLRWTPWRPAPAEGENVPPPKTQSRRIVLGARSLDIRYFGAPLPGEKPVWSDQWARADTIPDLVELRVTLPGEVKVRQVALRLRLP